MSIRRYREWNKIQGKRNSSNKLRVITLVDKKLFLSKKSVKRSTTPFKEILSSDEFNGDDTDTQVKLIKAGTMWTSTPNRRQHPIIFNRKVQRFFDKRELSSAQNMARAVVSVFLSLWGDTTFQLRFATVHSAIELSTASVGWCSSGWGSLTRWRTMEVLPTPASPRIMRTAVGEGTDPVARPVLHARRDSNTLGIWCVKNVIGVGISWM